MSESEFTHDGTTYEAVEGFGCDGCQIEGTKLCCNRGNYGKGPNVPNCSSEERSDNKSIIWKKRMTANEFTYDDVTYEAVEKIGCDGCQLYNTKLCHNHDMYYEVGFSVPRCGGGDRDNGSIIWKIKEELVVAKKPKPIKRSPLYGSWG